MFTDVISQPQLRSSWGLFPCGGETHFREEVVADRMKTAKGFAEARCSFADIEVIKIWPSVPCSDLNPRSVHIESVPAALCCWDGCHTEDISAVQRTFLDGFGHGGAQQSDDGTRVVAADHSAARHDHVGSCLEKT